MSYVDVSDSSNTGNTIDACFSTDSGNNSGWNFNPTSCYPDNGGSATSTITNFLLAQSALINNIRGGNNGAFTLPDNTSNGLPSQIFSFLKQLPAGQSLLAAAKEFLKAMLYGLVIGILLGMLLVWRHRRLEALAESEGLIDVPNSVIPDEPMDGISVRSAGRSRQYRHSNQEET